MSARTAAGRFDVELFVEKAVLVTLLGQSIDSVQEDVPQVACFIHSDVEGHSFADTLYAFCMIS